MTDFMSPEQRSHAMSQVRGNDTKIEILVRSLLHGKGFRFRKNVTELPGRPDIVLTKYSATIFVHGCFWHGHYACIKSGLPQTNTEFWISKIRRTKERDKEKSDVLTASGWRVAVLWQCCLSNAKSAKNAVDMLADWINSKKAQFEFPER